MIESAEIHIQRVDCMKTLNFLPISYQGNNDDYSDNIENKIDREEINKEIKIDRKKLP